MGKPLSYDNSLEYTAKAEEPTVTADRKATWKDFVNLTKPGIIMSNLMTTFAGFWVAQGEFSYATLLFALIGTALVMASGCVLNNYLDRDLDVKMERTRKRALPTGLIKPGVVMGYGIALGVAGIAVLGLLVNVLAALLGMLGLFVYVWLYTAWLKRTSVWNTVVGAISGAVPPVIGYVAVSQTLDAGAWVLFAILFLWQPPHFWALGIRRMDEYREAGYKMLPAVKGAYLTKISMMRYVVPLVPVSLLLYFYGYVGEIYLFGATVLGLIWLFMTAKGFQVRGGEEQTQWAKKVFLFSINYLTLLSILMVVDSVA